MKYKIEDFKNKKIVVNTETQKEYDEFMEFCEKNNLRWGGGEKPTQSNHYNFYKEKTCIEFLGNGLLYSDINHFIRDGYKVVKFKDLLKFTKSDLKDNHIVVDNYGWKRLWGNITYKEDYKENLFHKCVDKYSINEVWEFDKLVWEREEQILDEIEKKYLSDVIRPFRDRVASITKEKHTYGEKIRIYYDQKTNVTSYMSLPYFEEGTMYKGMEIDKEYSLKDLGL